MSATVVLAVVLWHAAEGAPQQQAQRPLPPPIDVTVPTAPTQTPPPADWRVTGLSVPRAGAGNGIFVGTPKVYDNQALQALLASARVRLAAINAFDQSGLLQRLGTTQGASVTQSQLGVQATSLPVPGITETVTESATPSTQTQTQRPQAAAVLPSAPSPPTFAVPSTFGVSSLDLLNEQTQLSAELINLQLLLGGSLTDDFLPDDRQTRQKVTIGFPITVIPPPGFDYRNAVAETEVSLCSPVDSPATPTIVTLLPKERTYNVASVVSKSSSIGVGAVSGVLNLGSSFLRGRQTMYIVRDQDTVALQRATASQCTQRVLTPDEIERIEKEKVKITPRDIRTPYVAFAWQFRPVLGRQVLTGGTRETFVQVSLPPNVGACPIQAVVRTVWRRYDVETGRVGADVSGSAHTDWLTVPGFDVTPRPTKVDAFDNGDGTVTVIAEGMFTASVRVRVGSTVHDETTAGFERTPNRLRFVTAASALAQNGAVFFDRDSHAARVEPPSTANELTPCQMERAALRKEADRVQKLRSQQQQPKLQEAPAAAGAADAAGDAPGSPVVGSPVRPSPVTTALSRVTITVTHPIPATAPDLPVVLIGSRVFGLRDAPFDSINRATGEISFRAPTDLLRTNREIKYMRLLDGTPLLLFPIDAGIADFAVSGISLLSADAAKGNQYVLGGTGLTRLEVLFPADVAKPVVDASGTTALLTLTKEQLNGLKNIIVRRDSEPPILVALPAVAPEVKPPLERHKPLTVGARILEVAGSLYDSVLMVRYLEKPLMFTVDKTAKKLLVALPEAMTASTGTQVLEFVFSDKTTVRYEVVVDPK